MSSWWGYFPRWKPDPREKQKKRRMEEFWKTDATEKRKNKRMGEFFGCTFLYIKNDPFCFRWNPFWKYIIQFFTEHWWSFRKYVGRVMELGLQNSSIFPFFRSYVFTFFRSYVLPLSWPALIRNRVISWSWHGTNPFFQVVTTLTLLIMSFCH